MIEAHWPRALSKAALVALIVALGCQSADEKPRSKPANAAKPRVSKPKPAKKVAARKAPRKKVSKRPPTEQEKATAKLLMRLNENPTDAATIAALAEIGDGAVPILGLALSSASPDLRRSIVKILGAISGKTSLHTLFVAVSDADPTVRAASAEALGKKADPTAVPILVARYDREDDASTRYQILSALGQIGTPGAIPLLTKEAKSSDGGTRMWAGGALCAMKAPEASAISKGLLADPDEKVREHVTKVCADDAS